MEQQKPPSTLSAVSVGSSTGKSGAGMDRKIDRRRWPVKKVALAFLVAGLMVFVAWLALSVSDGRSLQVDSGRVNISSVTRGTFEDFIPIRGSVTPRRTVFLDSIEGGRVEQRLVEDGALVEANQILAVLSNTSLQLDVTRNEALATEQLNNMRTIELQLEQNRLEHKRNLVEINYQIKRLTRTIERQEGLAARGVSAQSTLDDARDELEYFENRRAVTLESQEADARLQQTQLEFMRDNTDRLERNVVYARKNLDSLNVRAPVAGKLSGWDVEVGQSISNGGRLGQVDDPENFKLRANIDEFYLGRVQIDQAASFERDGERHTLKISKIYPQVNNGQFDVDLVFDEAEPEGIRRGQTLQLKLTLGDATEATLIPNGAFFQDTGGNWIFVVTTDGSEALRRPVRLGRRNSRFIEVLEGLEPGERVVTSPYTSYTDMQRLKLADESSSK
ncbi:efflux RND transporter periplasmic adaptor subunit [Congregibacter variabilis]|uniref:Efflux RND transporter periplasmic adaptor subunit n=1 Tax=Congregibacter variabilis TaxID=3081200 RepID=A0ABZ0I5H3_9GAMM|nr:efflux RND transporter periplasmic adaptor subunit [Congregibacter sp. IMCC43200]